MSEHTTLGCRFGGNSTLFRHCLKNVSPRRLPLVHQHPGEPSGQRRQQLAQPHSHDLRDRRTACVVRPVVTCDRRRLSWVEVLRIRHVVGALAQPSRISGWRRVHSRSCAATSGRRSVRRSGRPAGGGRSSMCSRMPSRRSATSKFSWSQAKWNAIRMWSDSRRCFRFGPGCGGGTFWSRTASGMTFAVP
jgi:hypothetical protein